MRKIVFFAVIFGFLYSFHPKILPLPIIRIWQLFGFILLLSEKKDLLKLLKSKSAHTILRISFIFLLLCAFAELQNPGLETFLIKPVNVFLDFFSGYFVYWCAKKAYKEVNVNLVLKFIVLAGITQTIISLFFFFNPSLYELYSSLLHPSSLERFDKYYAMLGRRFVGISSNSFMGSVKFGFPFFALIILPYIDQGKLVKNKVLYWGALVLIILGGVFTARTFFVTIIFGLFLVFLINSNNIYQLIKVNIKIFFTFLLTLIASYVFLSLFVNLDGLERSFEWAFEMFYNLNEGKGLKTTSGTGLRNMYILPDSLKTWLIGDGLFMNPHGEGYYMNTDAGIMRMIYYFGLPSTLFVFYMLWKFQKVLKRMTPSTYLKYTLLVITLWQITLNIKGVVMNFEYYVLFLIFMLYDDNNSIREKI